MAIVTLRLPDVKIVPAGRPPAGPHCGAVTLQCWGQRAKPLIAPFTTTVFLQHYRCSACHRVFSHYPDGVDHADLSLRFRTLVALMWMPGLSYRGVAAVCDAFRVALGVMTVWRDVSGLGAQRRAAVADRRAPVLGVDGVALPRNDQTVGMVVVDLGTGDVLALAHLDAHDPRAVVTWLEPLVQAWGTEVLVTDDLQASRTAAEQLRLDLQVCWFHVRRWVAQALREVAPQREDAWRWAVVQEIMQEAPRDGSAQVLAGWQALPDRSRQRGKQEPLERLRQLVLRGRNGWHSYQ